MFDLICLAACLIAWSAAMVAVMLDYQNQNDYNSPHKFKITFTGETIKND